MRLSILDQAPISSNQTANQALNESMRLAQAAETFGYTRYWIAEHHDLPGLACSAPEDSILSIDCKEAIPLS
jgi:alkanesulfonate monooxygenase SsuD/methylene tetrahydromethanopterin reductase-like flavin-dependent oxidoreductase (luciferase family)